MISVQLKDRVAWCKIMMQFMLYACSLETLITSLALSHWTAVYLPLFFHGV